MSSLAQGIRSQLEFNFAIPTALNTDVKGVDQDSGRDEFNVRSANMMLDMTNLVDPTLQHRIFTTRLNNVRERITTTAQCLTTTTPQLGFRPSFPKPLGQGTVNWVSQQPSGAFQTHSLLITFQNPLAV